MCQAESSVRAEEDDAAATAETAVKIGHGFACGEFGSSAISDAIDSPFAEHELHDGLAPAREGDGCGEIIRVATAADERRVADAAGCFVKSASGGCAGSKVAANIESDCANCVVALKFFGFNSAIDCCFGALVVFESAESVVGETGGLALFRLLQSFTLAVEDKFKILDEGHSVCAGEFLGSSSNEVDMRTLLENEARCLDRIAQPLDAGDATGFHAATIHEESV